MTQIAGMSPKSPPLVLILDDEPSLARMIGDWVSEVQDLPCEVVVTTSLNEALVFIETHANRARLAAVVSDVSMRIIPSPSHCPRCGGPVQTGTPQFSAIYESGLPIEHQTVICTHGCGGERGVVVTAPQVLYSQMRQLGLLHVGFILLTARDRPSGTVLADISRALATDSERLYSIQKPDHINDEDKVRSYVQSAVRAEVQRHLVKQNHERETADILSSYLIGRSNQILELRRTVSQVAPSSCNVLIRGETGVGKELVARAIHHHSQRNSGPFVIMNCAALPESLVESELFGHEKGSFTGATEKRIGKFELADGGTIFLDEIGEMSLTAQSKLLRVLDGHPFERVGGKSPVEVNVRLVSATNRDLSSMVRARTFREDLFYRIKVFEIHVPPLRDRIEDIPMIAEFFLRQFAVDSGKVVPRFSPSAVRRMQEHRWPGNVRELKNVVMRAMAVASSDAILTEVDLELAGSENSPAHPPVAFRLGDNSTGKGRRIRDDEYWEGIISVWTQCPARGGWVALANQLAQWLKEKGLTPPQSLHTRIQQVVKKKRDEAETVDTATSIISYLQD